MRRASTSPRYVPETDKKPGLRYLVSDAGLELPLIDLGHPAFALEPSEAELSRFFADAMRDLESRRRLPPFLQRLLLRLFLRKSLLANKISGAAGGFLDGEGTYLLKLGPDNLGKGYAGEVDRRIAASLPCLSARLRLKATARLLADSLREDLRAVPGRRLALLNIAGGPSMDSLNALLSLRREEPGLLSGRGISLDILDVDGSGPSFGLRAIDAFREEEGPLSELELVSRHLPYDWSTWRLGLPGAGDRAGAVLAASSEGGLFEYGSDEDIGGNLDALRREGEASLAFVGSISRGEGEAGELNRQGAAAVRLWEGRDFERLAEEAGWEIAREIPCPLCRVLLLRPR